MRETEVFLLACGPWVAGIYLFQEYLILSNGRNVATLVFLALFILNSTSATGVQSLITVPGSQVYEVLCASQSVSFKVLFSLRWLLWPLDISQDWISMIL